METRSRNKDKRIPSDLMQRTPDEFFIENPAFVRSNRKIEEKSDATIANQEPEGEKMEEEKRDGEGFKMPHRFGSRPSHAESETAIRRGDGKETFPFGCGC